MQVWIHAKPATEEGARQGSEFELLLDDEDLERLRVGEGISRETVVAGEPMAFTISRRSGPDDEQQNHP